MNSTAIMFNVINEARKALQVITEIPSRYPMRAIAEDLKAMGFEDYDVGFFILLLKSADPHRPVFGVIDQEKALELINKLKLQYLSDDYWIATSGCTWDIAKERYKATQDINYRAVVFSTPEQLMVLAENPN